jgi:hypothetical protein
MPSVTEASTSVLGKQREADFGHAPGGRPFFLPYPLSPLRVDGIGDRRGNSEVLIGASRRDSGHTSERANSRGAGSMTGNSDVTRLGKGCRLTGCRLVKRLYAVGELAARTKVTRKTIESGIPEKLSR